MLNRNEQQMAAAQLTASSIKVPARNLTSFEGLRPSSVKFAYVGGAPSQRSFRRLVVKAATVVAPKVIFSFNKNIIYNSKIYSLFFFECLASCLVFGELMHYQFFMNFWEIIF